MSREALKFFHSYIREMIDIGGENLPKTISTRLGGKLAKIYQKMGITDVIEGLRESYRAIKGNPEITKIDDHTYEVRNKYLRKFCPIGGHPQNSNQAEIVQNCVCQPFTIGFLSALDPSFKYEGEVKECILASNKKVCRYILHISKKNGQ